MRGALPDSPSALRAPAEPGRAPPFEFGNFILGGGRAGREQPPSSAWGGHVPRPLAAPRGEFAPRRGSASIAAACGSSMTEVEVGVGWGSHHVCAIDGGGVLGERSFAHGGEGLAGMADWISNLLAMVAIEVPHGPMVNGALRSSCGVVAPQGARQGARRGVAGIPRSARSGASGRSADRQPERENRRDRIAALEDEERLRSIPGVGPASAIHARRWRTRGATPRPG